METISLTFKSESHHPIIGCGIDCETISRFTKYIDQPHPLPFIFSRKEVEHIHTLEDKAIGFCAAFCCKEAVFKAIDQPFNFNQCQFFYQPNRKTQPPPLLESIDSFAAVSRCSINIHFPDDIELMAIVHLFGASQ